jgi:hypothetical protein
VATHRNRFAAHGKEGVSGSSPEECLIACLALGVIAATGERVAGTWVVQRSSWAPRADSLAVNPAVARREMPGVAGRVFGEAIQLDSPTLLRLRGPLALWSRRAHHLWAPVLGGRGSE